MTLAAFNREAARLHDILAAINLLTWDARVMMPAGGATARGAQIATLTGLARDLATGDAFAGAIEAARQELGQAPGDSLDRRAVETTAAAVATLKRIPAALIEEAASLKTVAQSAWAAARRDDDFKGFAPLLQRTIAIQREMAEAIGYARHPYDAMIALYEPELDWARLQSVYAELKTGLLPLVARARAIDQPAADFLTRAFPVERQKQFGQAMATRMGFDFARGRLDETVHPFEISFSPQDVRITARYRENFLQGGLFAVWHEAGHGIYEQGIAPEFSRSAFSSDLVNLYAVGGASFAMHESQSRLYENRVGRSRRFWELHFGELRDHFPEQLAGVDADAFWRGVNAVRPSLIRVEADELTYDLHIMLRSEIEAGLMAGDIAVNDLPAVWREKMRDSLGLDVPSDTLGVLQDVHWSSGMVGSFPTYTLGNIMSSQFFAAAEKDAGVAAGLEDGDYRPLTAWLGDKVHRHARASSPAETLQRATGSGLDLAPYLADLTRKVNALSAA